MCLRADNPETVQAYLGIYPRDDALRKTLRDSMATRDPDAQKRLYTELFKNEGWQASRIVKGMNETRNFYCQETAQVKTKIWSKGRVVLLGDAAHCASPVTGLGTTSAIVGAYVLAGEIATHCGGADKEGISDAHGALLAYNKTLRPIVDRLQQLFPGVPGLHSQARGSGSGFRTRRGGRYHGFKWISLPNILHPTTSRAGPCQIIPSCNCSLSLNEFTRFRSARLNRARQLAKARRTEVFQNS
ncbi:hypothetical protein EV126DRAFT_91590 [Verticillium dahliae]|nr:hypothetical protein EV126DRAFT_91590 [Verticillium dahliae]